MKTTVFLSLFSILFCSVGWSGNTVGNGGDSVAAEFAKMARNTISKYRISVFKPENRQIVLDLKQAVAATHLTSEEVLFLDSREVDAINYPDEMHIVVSRSRWNELRRSKKELLVLHEYLWIAGYDDSSYQISLEIKEDSWEPIIIPQF